MVVFSFMDIDSGVITWPKLLENIEAMEEEEDKETQRKNSFFYFAGDTLEILTAISKGLSVQDLRNFRLASTRFYRTSLATWRRKTVPRVNIARRRLCYLHKRYNPELTIGQAINLPIRNDDMLKLGKYPIKEFKFLDWWNDDTDEEHDKMIKQFFTKWSSSLQHVELYKGDSAGSPEMIRALKYARNLKTLTLNECYLQDFTKQNGKYVEQDEDIKSIKGLTVTRLNINACYEPVMTHAEMQSFTILKELPLLKELNVHLRFPVLYVSYCSPQPGLIDSLQSYRKWVGNGLLRVKISGIAKFDGSLDELLQAAVPLEQYHVWDPLDLPARFQNNLSIHARKLGWLRLYHTSNINAYHPAFPFDIEVPVLLKIHLIGKITNSFNFLKFMPVLEKVVIRLQAEYNEKNTNRNSNLEIGETGETGRENEDFVENMLESYKLDLEMKHLTHLNTDRYFKIESLPVLRKLMPNLVILKMVFQSNEMFRFVCENWPKLTKLKALPGSRLDDSGITGVESIKGTIQNPNLTSLKDLAVFEIWSEHVLTDQSVIWSFLLMKKMTKLVIHTYTNFSDSCKILLGDKFGDWRKERPLSYPSSFCSIEDISSEIFKFMKDNL